MSTLIHCDRIFVMHEGAIIGQANHQSLLDRRGWYHEMAQRQLGLEMRPAA